MIANGSDGDARETLVTDLVFSEAVKAEQARLGSRAMVDRMSRNRGFQTTVTEDLAAFAAARDSIYVATASAGGQPYVQHRGGPAGFLRVVDDKRLAWAERPGNRQFVTFGNLTENDRISLFLMDYPNRRRVKIWGRGVVVERESDDEHPVWRALEDGETRAVVVEIEAWDVNCPQYITPRYVEADVLAATTALRRAIADKDEALAERDAEIAALKARLAAAEATRM